MLSTLVFIGRVRHNLSIESLIGKNTLFLYTVNKKYFAFLRYKKLKKGKYFSLTVRWLCIKILQIQFFFQLRLYLVCMKCLLIPWDPQSNLNKVQLLRTLRWQSYKSINSLIPSGWEEPSLNDSARFVKGAILLLMLHVISFFRSTICNSIGFYPILASKFETWARYHGTNTNLFLTPTSNFPLESDLKKKLVIKDLVQVLTNGSNKKRCFFFRSDF